MRERASTGRLNKVLLFLSKIRRVRQPHEAYRLGGAPERRGGAQVPKGVKMLSPRAERRAARRLVDEPSGEAGEAAHAARTHRSHRSGRATRIGGGEARTAAEERDERRDEVELRGRHRHQAHQRTDRGRVNKRARERPCLLYTSPSPRDS